MLASGPRADSPDRELISRWLHNVEAVKIWAAQPGDDPQNINWWHPAAPTRHDELELKVQEFIGQGRKIQYCGLPQALLAGTERTNFETLTKAGLDAIAVKTASELHGWKPKAWYVVACLSLLLVWVAIMSAFVVSYNAPTVGIGCRTLSYLLFGGFSTVSWGIQFSKRPHGWMVGISYLFNILAIMALCAVILFQVRSQWLQKVCEQAN